MSSTPPTQSAEAEPVKFRIWRWLLGLPIVIFIVLMLASELMFSIAPDKETRWIERESIRQCWKDIKRQPDEDKPRHFTDAQECQALEQAFTQRWGEAP
ncbi:MAG: hypothetical protein KIG95_11065 [Comamonas sp.]|nr:hypothetical protein [Comamonas sp.]